MFRAGWPKLALRAMLSLRAAMQLLHNWLVAVETALSARAPTGGKRQGEPEFARMTSTVHACEVDPARNSPVYSPSGSLAGFHTSCPVGIAAFNTQTAQASGCPGWYRNSVLFHNQSH